MGEKLHGNGGTTDKEEEVNEVATSAKERAMTEELLALRGMVAQLTKSRLVDKWALENQLDNMTEEVKNLDVRMKQQQETNIVMVQDNFERKLNKMKTEWLRKSDVLEKGVNDMHCKMDRLINMMSKLPSDGFTVPEFTPTTAPKQEQHHGQSYSSERQANQSAAAKKGKKKRRTKRVEETREAYSSMSEETDDYDEPSRLLYSRRSGRYACCRTPSPPPMQTFHGEPCKWRMFLFQFEQLSKVYHWSAEEQLQKILICMRDSAAEYLESHPEIVKDYHTLVKQLTRRFCDRAPARTMRRQLNFIQQGANENIDDFSDRVHKTAMKGYPGTDSECIQSFAIDALFHGCNNKFAALTVMGTKPPTLFQAVKRLKDAIEDQQFLNTQPLLCQISHMESSSEQQANNSPDNLSQIIATAVKKAFEENSTSKLATHSVRSSSFTCFACGMRGHFARDCHRKSHSKQPVGDPWTTNVCSQCGNTGHFARVCDSSWTSRLHSSSASWKKK